jgi:hypothetical protein
MASSASDISDEIQRRRFRANDEYVKFIWAMISNDYMRGAFEGEVFDKVADQSMQRKLKAAFQAMEGERKVQRALSGNGANGALYLSAYQAYEGGVRETSHGGAFFHFMTMVNVGLCSEKGSIRQVLGLGGGELKTYGDRCKWLAENPRVAQFYGLMVVDGRVYQ